MEILFLNKQYRKNKFFQKKKILVKKIYIFDPLRACNACASRRRWSFVEDNSLEKIDCVKPESLHRPFRGPTRKSRTFNTITFAIPVFSPFLVGKIRSFVEIFFAKTLKKSNFNWILFLNVTRLVFHMWNNSFSLGFLKIHNLLKWKKNSFSERISLNRNLIFFLLAVAGFVAF